MDRLKIKFQGDEKTRRQRKRWEWNSDYKQRGVLKTKAGAAKK